ncbi:AfsR/SARP family transcriptional regulator [Streptomyces iranensis]|uniref:AfsR/SARP family transcriptional regulator n=1 Tax=Streptomyces iranensis TaxID=576784 RepID=UPI00099CF4A9
MDFRLLGPLELWVGGTRQYLGSVKERCLLAALLCAEGAPVPADTLMRRAWADVPPSGTATLQSNISRLRSRLRTATGDQTRIDFSARSYSLHVPSECVDLRRFRDLRRQAGSAAADGDIESAAALLHKAESLWRAEPLAEFTGGWVAATRRRLTENLRQVREQRITWELDLGRHADLVAELYDLLAHERDPEPFAQHLMLALHRCGRHGDALAVYTQARRRLSQVLGADPSPELERLHQRILARDVALQGPRPERHRPASAHPPDNLPRDLSDFSGREHELAGLLSMPRSETTALPLTVVHGMAGVGKTALITHAAHRLRAQYPDGRLHVHLRAHHEQPPVDPADALAILLQAIGVTSEELPAAIDARAALWRGRTAHRSVLLLLDDARDAAQIRPLLPGTATCRVLVTSRYRLADLEGVHSLALDVLDTTEASGMFTRIAGAQRTSDVSAVRQVVNLCKRYPLAIRLAANRFLHREAWDTQDLAERLARSVSPLDEIDTQSGIATAFDFSYAELRAADQRLFRALALHPGPDLTLDVIAALAGVDVAQARRSVDELVGAHLLEEPIKHRYRLHDVVRDIARTASEHHDTTYERRETVRRILDHYLAAADQSDRLAYPQRRRLEVPSGYSSAIPELDSAETALAWFDLNRGNLLAAAQLAAAEYPEHAMYFPHVLDRAFHVWGMWEAAASLNSTALVHARTHGVPAVTAQILIERAAMLRPQGAHQEALQHATEALAHGQATGDVWLQGEALEQTGIVDLVSGRLSDALERFREALSLHKRAGNRTGEAEALSHQGITLAHLGHLPQASRQFHAALAIHQGSDNMNGQIKALNNIGEVYALQGQQETAREYYERSLALVKKLGGRQELAILYNNLGNVCRDGNDVPQALSYFRMALENYEAICDRAGQADSLVNLGIAYQGQGQYAAAQDRLARAHEIAQEIDDQHQRQRILSATAAVYYRLGQGEAALKTYRKSLQAARKLKQRYEEAHTLEIIAEITEEIQGAHSAKKIWTDALEIYLELGLERQAHSMQEHIDGSEQPGPR